MADGLNINIGTEGSTLSGSKVSVNDVAGGNLERQLSDHILQEIKDVKERVKSIEVFLSGGSLGEPGLTSVVREVKMEIGRIEREIGLIGVLDNRFKKIEDNFVRYGPMWEQMYMAQRSKTDLSVQALYLIGIICALTAIGAAIIVWVGRG